MLSQLQASYQRMEQSLQKLTDSIAAYNPSPAAADELLAADDGVNADLEKLVTHQANYARIQALRNTTDSLDQTIRDTIKLLADTRKDISSIPATNTTTQNREVNVDELLRYAKFISKTTVPPAFRKPIPEVKIPYGADDQAQAQIRNGMATPPPGAQDSENTPYARSEIVGLHTMPLQSQDWLDPLKNLPFEPWPSHGIIQQGVLADVQRMVESGRDPASVLSPEEQAEADKRKAEGEEREKQEQEERDRLRQSYGAAQHRNMNRKDRFDPDEM